MPHIQKLTALEILDSRGRPTVEVCCELHGGISAHASIPSGASTGRAEAAELRDRDATRYGGLGCRRAVANVNDEINQAFSGREYKTQFDLDRALIDLDGSPNKSRLGANALLAVSIAFARAHAGMRGIPLFQHFADMIGVAPRMPRLTVNLFSGGKHAGRQVAIQDVLVVPPAGASVDESLSMIYAVYQAAVALTGKRYGARSLVADEGGLAPPFPNVNAMLDDAVESIRAAGLEPGRDMMLAIDVASSHFFEGGRYVLDGDSLTGSQMAARVSEWATRYPIISVEDGLAEDDWRNWPGMCAALAGKAIAMGDDLLCTNPVRISKAVGLKAANALLLKVNQIGTLTEAAEAGRLARDAGWAVTVSARSGETEDNWLADLAVGWRGDFIKVGSITRSERLAKYNRLLAIEKMLLAATAVSSLPR